MNRIRLIGRGVVGLLAVGVALVTTSTAAFAMRVIPQVGGNLPTPATAGPSGVGNWEIALVAFAAVILATVVVVKAMRLIHRPAAGSPATR